MNQSMHRCESCSMPIETGSYCQYCVTETGELQPFNERFDKMVSWQIRQKPGISRADAERDTLEFMAKMPAWKDHPELEARRAGR
jgi:hypothetical protein